MCLLCQPYITRRITKKVDDIKIWEMEDATKEIQEKMKQTWFIFTLCILLSQTASLMLLISYVLPTPQDNDIIWIFKLIHVYFPQWESLLVWCLIKPTICILCYLGISVPAFAIYYYHGHISLQMYMLKHYLQNINSNARSTNYHQEVNKRLLFCVRSHTRLVK